MGEVPSRHGENPNRYDEYAHSGSDRSGTHAVAAATGCVAHTQAGRHKLVHAAVVPGRAARCPRGVLAATITITIAQEARRESRGRRGDAR